MFLKLIKKNFFLKLINIDKNKFYRFQFSSGSKIYIWNKIYNLYKKYYLKFKYVYKISIDFFFVGKNKNQLKLINYSYCASPIDDENRFISNFLKKQNGFY